MQLRRDAARMLIAARSEIAAKLAGLVADWPKYAAEYRADAASFAEREMAALVDYLARFLDDADDSFLQLYIGEKIKQFYDPDTSAAVRQAREKELLIGERWVFCRAVRALPGATGLIETLFDQVDHALLSSAPQQLAILFVGDCLYLDVSSFIAGPALSDGIRIIPTYVATHDQGEIRAALSKLADKRFDAVFFSPLTYGFLSSYADLQRPRAALDPLRAPGLIAATVAAGESIFDTIADLFDCPLIVHLPTPILRHDDRWRQRLSGWLSAPARSMAVARLRNSLAQRIATRQEAGQAIMALDEEDLVRKIGKQAAGKYLYRSQLQHPARFGTLVAQAYRDIFYALAWLAGRKVVVCDLDNTLWAGVIGEGLGVEHHLVRQAPLLRLKQRGAVLAINSKNDPNKVVWEAAGGGLGLDDFVSRQINWRQKSDNITTIAQHLNLKEKDFVFIDDRADEREMVSERFPKLLCLDAEDSRSWRALDIWADLLPAKPGADRTDFYRQRDARQAFIADDAVNSAEQRAESYKNLNLVFDIREAEAEDLARVVDLVNRTNQFNMVGSRITRRQAEDWLADSRARILIADAGDRFGKMGTVCVLVVEPQDGGLGIASFVLSCRVFGYDMEFAMVEAARSLCSGADDLFGPFLATEHNQPCADVYRSAGFSPAPGGWLLEHAATRQVAVPDWLKVRFTMPAL